MADFETVTYRRVAGIDLVAEVFTPLPTPTRVPAGAKARAAVVFFHGGSWRSGGPDTFRVHCSYLAERGMIAATVSYRLLPDQARGLVDCVADAQAAVRWMRSYAGVDGNRVAAGGLSAGGHLAACTALVDRVERAARGSHRPDALVLMNPGLDLGRWSPEFSPLHLVRPDVPPTLIIQGNRDTMAPPGRARAFAREMAKVDNRCELTEFDGAHTVFSHRRVVSRAGFVGGLARIDEFLVSLGFLPPAADVVERIERLADSLAAASAPRRRTPR